MKNTKELGSIGELIVMTQSAIRGYVACVPFGDNQKYDLVLEKNGKFIRVQVKTITPKDNKLTLATYNVQHNPNKEDERSYTRTSYTKEDVDVFILVDAITHQTYCVPVELVTKTTLILRLDPKTENHRTKYSKWAIDFMEW